MPFQSNTTYTEWAPSNTPDIQAVRDLPDQNEFLAPSIQAGYDRTRQRFGQQLNSSYNQNIPQTARLAMQRDFDRDTMADEGMAKAQAGYNAQNAALQRRLALAGITTGSPLQSGQGGFNSQFAPQQQSSGIWNSIIGGASNVLGAGITAGAFV